MAVARRLAAVALILFARANNPVLEVEVLVGDTSQPLVLRDGSDPCEIIRSFCGPRDACVWQLVKHVQPLLQADWAAASARLAISDAYLAGYGPPRPKKPNALAGVEVHVVANALGPAEPPHSALQALVSAAGGRSVALRNCRVALVGESWTPYKAPAALRALHRNGHVLRVRWLFDAIEHQDPARPQATYRVPA